MSKTVRNFDATIHNEQYLQEFLRPVLTAQDMICDASSKNPSMVSGTSRWTPFTLFCAVSGFRKSGMMQLDARSLGTLTLITGKKSRCHPAGT